MTTRKVFTVSRLNQEVHALLEQGFGTLWLEGELSNLSRPGSGHLYFSLKDSRAQIRCAMFKGRNRYLDFTPDNGLAVLARGKLGLYSARGDFQFIVEHLEEAGAGRLQAAFERTREALDAAGWFAMENKRALPAMPRSIGVVTSPSSAALADVLQVLGRRAPQIPVVIYPCTTQGAQAAPDIVRALAQAGRRAETDVLLLVRGGGSLEDLWAFNERSVAAAIRDCPIPLISGVGHEVDVTIADLVADQRAPTPSASAELAAPPIDQLSARLQQARLRLRQTVQQQLARRRGSLTSLVDRIQARHPSRRLNEGRQRVDELLIRLERAWLAEQRHRQTRLQALLRRLSGRTPAHRLRENRTALGQLESRLAGGMAQTLATRRHRLQLASRALETVSPLAVLERGYALIEHEGRLVSSVDDVSVDSTIVARLANGELEARITTVTQATDGEK